MPLMQTKVNCRTKENAVEPMKSIGIQDSCLEILLQICSFYTTSSNCNPSSMYMCVLWSTTFVSASSRLAKLQAPGPAKRGPACQVPSCSLTNMPGGMRNACMSCSRGYFSTAWLRPAQKMARCSIRQAYKASCTTKKVQQTNEM